MIKIKYGDNNLFLTIPKSLLKDKNIKKFFEYIKLRAIVDKSEATEENIKEIVEIVKKRGIREVDNLLNEN